MKRFVSALLALVLTMGSACSAEVGGGLSGLPGAAQTPENQRTDYINASLVVEKWPELPENGIPIFYEDDKCLVMPLPGEQFAPFIYDTADGDISYMNYYEEDLPAWKKLLVDNLAYLDFTEEEVVEMCDPYYMEYYFYISQGQDPLTSLSILPGEIVVNLRYESFAIDTKWPAIRLVDGIEFGGGAGVKWQNDQAVDYIYTDSEGNKTDVHIIGDPGYEYTPSCLDFEWDTVVMAVRDTNIGSRNCGFALGFADGYASGAMEFIDLGTYPMSGGPTMARLCGSDAALAYNISTMTMYPVLLVTREGARALIWDGNTMAAVDTAELAGEDGVISAMGEGYRYLYPLDVSGDGRYAAFIEGGSGDLLIMDVETLETRCLMTQAEMTAMGYGSMMSELSGWFTDDIIIGKNGYHLRFVFE